MTKSFLDLEMERLMREEEAGAEPRAEADPNWDKPPDTAFMRCPTCKGTGAKDGRPCPDCDGDGLKRPAIEPRGSFAGAWWTPNVPTRTQGYSNGRGNARRYVDRNGQR